MSLRSFRRRRTFHSVCSVSGSRIGADEIGIRLAIGARWGDVLRMMLGMAARWVAIGPVSGVPAWHAAAR